MAQVGNWKTKCFVHSNPSPDPYASPRCQPETKAGTRGACFPDSINNCYSVKLNHAFLFQVLELATQKCCNQEI